MTIQKIFTSRSVANIDTFVGDKGHLFYSETDGVLRLSDGQTPGGTIVSSSTGGGGISDLDGGTPTSTYGGTTSIDAGGVV